MGFLRAQKALFLSTKVVFVLSFRYKIEEVKTMNNQNSKRIGDFLRNEYSEFQVLVKSIPSILLIFFVLAVFCMNLLANKSINLPFEWLALDCGLIVSWFVFFALDVLTKHFGPKAATQISVFATLINLILCLVFYAASSIPGTWGESYVAGSEAVIGTALDNTFGGTWYIILGSAIAFTLAAFINNFMNYAVGKIFKNNPDGMGAYLTRSYVSTTIGQFADNFIFAFLVSRTFFGWTLTQCITCSLFGMIVELICEAVFSPLGYKICTKWKKNKVGKEYLNLVNAAA